MILLSAHKDTVFNNYKLSFDKGVYRGLLDNFIGVLVANMTVLEEPNLLHLVKENKLSVLFSGAEEWGLTYDFPMLRPKDLVIVVDVCAGKQYKGMDFSLENISGFEPSAIKEVKENLEWEGFKLLTKKYTGADIDEDEAFQWVKMGVRVMSFIIPIDAGKNDQWHTENCSITLEAVLKAKHGLTRLINYLL